MVEQKIDPKECRHESFQSFVAIARMQDTGAFMAEISISCETCGEPFRFVGVPAGIHFEHPTVQIDGIKLFAPIEPEIEKRLLDRASFTMPASTGPLRH